MGTMVFRKMDGDATEPGRQGTPHDGRKQTARESSGKRAFGGARHRRMEHNQVHKFLEQSLFTAPVGIKQ
ncbi:MAG: hypothetical protein BWY09_01893 [Candidatus Hydrogenedentes bacterium ADurb.Bin179]|nr:MAG: hypothetical protein BWY09_01893 [Candidatus Hydrogenedentes bacterium ADurb.Bin179]